VVQKIRVELVCDVCAGEVPAERTQGFSFDDETGKRREYKIELCNRHLKELGESLTPWVTKARLDGGTAKRSKGRQPSGLVTTSGNGRRPARRDAEQLAGIRIWARNNGFEVSDRGKIPAEVEEAYNRQSQ